MPRPTPRPRRTVRARLLFGASAALAAALTLAVTTGCGGRGRTERRTLGSSSVGGVDADDSLDGSPETSPVAKAEAGGWTGAPLEAPPHYCNDDGGQEWCDGVHDDDCDGFVDEGCADCVTQPCVRFPISEEQMRRGAGREGSGECVGPIYCGRIDGYATTSPPGGCGQHHCATVIWADRTAQPDHCTIYGRCVGGEFIAKGYSW